MNETLLLWLVFGVLVSALLVFDLGLFSRRAELVTARMALVRSTAYIVLAGLFGAGVFLLKGAEAGLQFATGYLVEYSLSLDNVFVFALIFAQFRVPQEYQNRVLLWGIIGALVMRGAMILAGTSLIENFHWTIYLFGALLVALGLKMLVAADSEPDVNDNPVVRLARRHVRMTPDYAGAAFVVRRDGLLYATPLLLVIGVIAVTDLLFAVDSIPAIFAITTDPFIVWTSNVFAVLGLRSLYFALLAVIYRFQYLKYGLALVLVVVGTKLLLSDIYKLPTWGALVITASIIAGSIVFSVVKTRFVAQSRGVPAPGD